MSDIPYWEDAYKRTAKPAQSNPLQRLFAWLTTDGISVLVLAGLIALAYFSKSDSPSPAKHAPGSGPSPAGIPNPRKWV